MKVLIISDIHGSFNDLKEVLEKEKSFDRLVILGDILNGPVDRESKEKTADLLNKYKDKILSVAGNNDGYLDELLDFNNTNYFNLLYIDNRIWFLTHGHIYNRYNMPDINYDIYLQGHRHVPLMSKENNKLYLNPGSISLPRQGTKTYMFYEDNIFYLKTIEGNIIQKIECS